MNTEKPNTEGQPGAEAEFKGLDPLLDPPSRCSTSLFKLLTGVAADARMIESGDVSKATDNDSGEKTLRLWLNRPGQNEFEAIMLALLSLWLIGGLTAGFIVASFGRHWWVCLVILALTPLLAFLALHLLTAIVAVTATCLKKLGICKGRSENEATLFLTLVGLTAIAVSTAMTGDLIYIAAAAPWLLWVTLDLIAWGLLLALTLAGSLKNLSQSPDA